MSAKGLLSAEACQSNFERGVALSLHLWPALTLAVQNNWGGPDSADKRDWFSGAVVDLFPAFTKIVSGCAVGNGKDTTEEPDIEYVETFLLQVMLDEFEVNVDDETGYEVAERILQMRVDTSKGKFEAVDDLRRKWEARKGTKVEGLYKKVEDADQDTDWESDDDEEEEERGSTNDDVDMSEAPPLVPVQKERQAAEVDNEGFTKVTRKKR